MSTYGSEPFIPAPPPPAASSKKWIWWVVGVIAACLVLTCCIALIAGIVLYTQGKFNLPFLGGGLKPTSGAVSGEGNLSAGFTDDPFNTPITGGGTIDAAKQNLGTATGCEGFVASAPTYKLTLTGSSSRLRFFSVSESGMDTTMIIRDPSGNWYCNDDAGDGGWDPMIDINNAGAGQYAIWLGSYTSGANVTSTFYVTELDYTPTNPYGSGNNGSGGLDVNGQPNFGTTSLSSGFTPDPFQTEMIGGGAIDVYSENLGTQDGSVCNGYVKTPPDYRIDFSGNSSKLRIFFVAYDGTDTTMVVNDALGNWYCNDDSGFGGMDPMVDLSNPSSGQINIWVGTYISGSDSPGTLYLTEQDIDPSTVNGGGNNTSEAIPGLAGQWQDPETQDIHTIIWENNGYYVTSTIATDGTNFPVVDQNWSNGILTWTYSVPGGAVVTFTTVSVSGDNLETTWSNDQNSSGDETLTRVSGSSSSSSDTLDYNLTPTYGSDTFGGPSSSQTFTLEMNGGGSVDVSSLGLGNGCTGYAASAPDYRIDYEGTASRLRIFFVAADGSDTTLIVNTPSVEWSCNDDDPLSGGRNPMVEFTNPDTGTYDIWVGTYSSSGYVSGTLYITVQDYNPSHLPN